MTTLILILIVPLVWPIAAKVIFGKSLNWGELAINLAVYKVVTTDATEEAFKTGRDKPVQLRQK